MFLIGSLEISDVLLRSDGKRGRWKLSSNKLVYSLISYLLKLDIYRSMARENVQDTFRPLCSASWCCYTSLN